MGVEIESGSKIEDLLRWKILKFLDSFVMYKSMEKTEDLALLPKNESSINIFQPDEEFLKNPFGDDKGNNAFWDKVCGFYFLQVLFLSFI